jgi:Tol biopolymer transport system component
METPEMRQLTTSPGLDTGPTLSPDGKWLAYSSDRSGQFEIYVKPLDGVDRETQITNDGGPNLEAAWSPDGKWIAYHCVARGGICMVPARGGTVRELAAVGSQPSWSPDSKKLVFRDAPLTSHSPLDIFPYVPGGITILDLDTGSQQHLQGGPAGNYGYPVWSSDGEWIVYAVLTLGKGSHIEAFNLQSGQRNLLANVKGINCSVRLSADRKRLYYTRFTPPSYFAFFSVNLAPQTMKPETEPQELVRLLKVPMRIEISRDDRKLLFSAPDHESNLYKVHPDGASAPLQLTQGRYFRTTGPSFSPDGKKIAYEVRGIGQASQLRMLNIDSTDDERLSDPSQPGSMPVWSADGRSIYSLGAMPWTYQRLELAGRTIRHWTSESAKRIQTWQSYSGRGEELLQHELHGQDFHLHFLNLANGKKTEIPIPGAKLGFAKLSPQGDQLAATQKDGGFSHLAIVPAIGGSPRQLTSGVEQVYPHSWSPDGRYVSFAGLRKGAWNICSIDVKSGVEKRLTNYLSLSAFVRYPAWSPRNDWIVYEHSAMKGNIYELDLPPR